MFIYSFFCFLFYQPEKLDSTSTTNSSRIQSHTTGIKEHVKPLQVVDSESSRKLAPPRPQAPLRQLKASTPLDSDENVSQDIKANGTLSLHQSDDNVGSNVYPRKQAILSTHDPQSLDRIKDGDCNTSLPCSLEKPRSLSINLRQEEQKAQDRMRSCTQSPVPTPRTRSNTIETHKIQSCCGDHNKPQNQQHINPPPVKPRPRPASPSKHQFQKNMPQQNDYPRAIPTVGSRNKSHNPLAATPSELTHPQTKPRSLSNTLPTSQQELNERQFVQKESQSPSSLSVSSQPVLLSRDALNDYDSNGRTVFVPKQDIVRPTGLPPPPPSPSEASDSHLRHPDDLETCSEHYDVQNHNATHQTSGKAAQRQSNISNISREHSSHQSCMQVTFQEELQRVLGDSKPEESTDPSHSLSRHCGIVSKPDINILISDQQPCSTQFFDGRYPRSSQSEDGSVDSVPFITQDPLTQSFYDGLRDRLRVWY